MRIDVSGNQPAILAKLIVFGIVSALGIHIFQSYVAFGFTLIAASLLQALIPPRRAGLVMMLTITGAFTVAAVIWQWASYR